MKALMSLILTAMFVSTAGAEVCKVGDFNGCANALRKVHKTNQSKSFMRAYDEVCGANVSFRCIKKIVRGDMNEEMKYTADEHKSGHLFAVKAESENFIYIFELKPDAGKVEIKPETKTETKASH